MQIEFRRSAVRSIWLQEINTMSAWSRRLVSLSAVFVLGILLIQSGSATTHGTSAKAAQTAASTSLPTLAATEPPTELIGGFRIQSRVSAEELEKPKLSIVIARPVLSGGPGAQADVFNKAVDSIVTKAVEDFKQRLLEIQGAATPESLSPDVPDSTLNISYGTFTPSSSSVISIRFLVGFYSRGAAHPGLYFVPLNYDLKSGKVLKLADLFQPNANYLEVIAEYCIDFLKAKGTLRFPEGAAPTETNYRNWNIGDTGLFIVFDEYQVAPYVEREQEVIVLYSILKPIVKADGPLSEFIKSGS
jgi:hypothetical protein